MTKYLSCLAHLYMLGLEGNSYIQEEGEKQPLPNSISKDCWKRRGSCYSYRISVAELPSCRSKILTS